MSDEVTIQMIMHAQKNELSSSYERFSSALVGAYDYQEAMEEALTSVMKLWHSMSYAFDLAYIELDEDIESFDRGWRSLEIMERKLRQAMEIRTPSLQNASKLLRILGVALSECERCTELWDVRADYSRTSHKKQTPLTD